MFHVKDHPRQVFEIDLVHDPGVRRHDLEIGKGLLAPLEETVALLVSLVFKFAVQVHGTIGTETVNLYRVINHQFCWLQRIDPVRVTAQVRHGVAHGGKVHDSGYPGKVLHQHPCRPECNFSFRLGLRVPGNQGLDIAAGDRVLVFMAQQVLQ